MNFRSRFSAMMATAFIVTIASFDHAGAGEIQMIPPVTEGTATACPSGSPRVLTWDGQTALACADGVTISGGRVGIGNTNPSSKLYVDDFLGSSDPTTSRVSAIVSFGTLPPNNISSGMLIEGNVGAGMAESGQLDLATNTAGGPIRLVFDDPNTGVTTAPAVIVAQENGPSYTLGGYLAFLVGSTAGGPSEKMRITTDGNVGIGTTNPDYPLTVGNIGGKLTSWGWAKAISIPAGGALVWQGTDEASNGNKLFMAYPSSDPPGYFYMGLTKADDGTTNPDYILEVDGIDTAADYGQFQFFKDVHAPNLDALQTQINALQAQIKALQADNHLVP
jgi:hypothetical protein